METVMKIILVKILLKIASLVCLALLVLTACAPTVPPTIVRTVIPSATAMHQTTSREAQVQSVEVQISQSNPRQVSAIVRGNLTESCATLGESQVQYESNAFQITVYANSPADIGCVQATTPFEATIPLDTKDLPAGSYTVAANGVSAIFTLPLENPTPTL